MLTFGVIGFGIWNLLIGSNNPTFITYSSVAVNVSNFQVDFGQCRREGWQTGVALGSSRWAISGALRTNCVFWFGNNIEFSMKKNDLTTKRQFWLSYWQRQWQIQLQGWLCGLMTISNQAAHNIDEEVDRTAMAGMLDL